MKTYVVTPHKKRFDETIIMMGHKMCFYGEIWIIISKLILLPLLIWITGIVKGYENMKYFGDIVSDRDTFAKYYLFPKINNCNNISQYAL